MAENISVRFKVGEFKFDPSSGTLDRIADVESPNKSHHRSGDFADKRLAPQPAQLLLLLIEQHPEVVSRESIQESLWPGIKTDFDSNLHFCIRQIRTAFGDSASDSKYIETIPRRGYRIHKNVEVGEYPNHQSNSGQQDSASRLNEQSNEHETKQTPPHREPHFDSISSQSTQPESIPSTNLERFMPTRFHLVAGTVIVLAMLGLLIYWAIAKSTVIAGPEDHSDVPMVAVMPFTTKQAAFKKLGDGNIAYDLLDLLKDDFGNRLNVAGPTTTSAYSNSASDLKKLSLDIDADWIVNGKFLTGDGNARLLVEIIRTSDGAHLWVKYFPASSQTTEVAEQIESALLKTIAN